MRERLRRWFHFQLCGWIGNHAPEGLVFQCVLRTYGKEYRKNPYMTAADMLNNSERRAEDRVKGKKS
jgi:hypothetical protein